MGYTCDAYVVNMWCVCCKPARLIFDSLLRMCVYILYYIYIMYWLRTGMHMKATCARARLCDRTVFIASFSSVSTFCFVLSKSSCTCHTFSYFSYQFIDIIFRVTVMSERSKMKVVFFQQVLIRFIQLCVRLLHTLALYSSQSTESVPWWLRYLYINNNNNNN